MTKHFLEEWGRGRGGQLGLVATLRVHGAAVDGESLCGRGRCTSSYHLHNIKHLILGFGGLWWLSKSSLLPENSSGKLHPGIFW